MSQNVNVNLVPGNYPKEFHVSQYDVGRQLVANIVDSTGAYSIPSGATVTLVGTKPSGFGFTLSGSVGSGGVVTFSTTATVTAEYGRIPCEIRITSGDTVLGTANLMLIVEESPHQEGVIDGNSETVIPELTILVERVEAAASSVLDMQVEADTLPAGSSATYSYDEETNTATFGIPQGEAGAGTAGVVASAYSASSTYAVGDYVIHDGNLYRCTTAITTAEAFTAAHWTQVVLGDDVSDLKSDLSYSLFDGKNVYNTKAMTFNNNTAVTNNNDGTYTIGTTDYGNTVFGGTVTLKAGLYKLYGVPMGKSHIGTTYRPADAIFTNETSTPKLFVLTSDADLVLAYSITSRPTNSFTITPYLYQTKIEDIIDKKNITTVINITGEGVDGESAGCVRAGDIYYNTNTKLLRKADNDALSSYSTVQYSDTALYYNMSSDTFYVYGTAQVPLMPIDSISSTNLESVELERNITKDVRENSVTIPTVGGKLIETSTNHGEVGYMQQHIVTSSDFNNWLTTSNFIKYDNNIVSIDGTGFDSISIFCYDNTFVCREQVASIADIPNYTSYIKIMAYKSTGFTYPVPINMVCMGELNFVKNTAPTLGTARYFSYEVSVGHYTNADETSDAYSGDQTRYYDDAYVILPPNYSPDGEPVQMVMYTHGSLGYAFGQTEPSYYELQQMIAKDGFLVCDCRALTSKYIAEDLAENTGNTGNLDDGITPLSVSCYCQLYDYMVSNYNVRTDGCYMYGKSSGGLMPALMSALRPFAVRASAGLAPMLSLFSDLDYIANESAMVYWQLQQFGYDMTRLSPEYPGPTRQQVLAQSELLLGYDPLLINSDLDEKTIDTYLANHSNNFADEDIPTYSNGKHKYQSVPIKIWVAVDDPYCRRGVIKLYKQVIDNANGICKVRYFSSGTGQHHAVDTSPNAPMVVYNTRYGGAINMPVAYAEMLDWFKQW